MLAAAWGARSASTLRCVAASCLLSCSALRSAWTRSCSNFLLKASSARIVLSRSRAVCRSRRSTFLAVIASTSAIVFARFLLADVSILCLDPCFFRFLLYLLFALFLASAAASSLASRSLLQAASRNLRRFKVSSADKNPWVSSLSSRAMILDSMR